MAPPTRPPPEPVVIDARIDGSVKRQLAASIVKMQDGTWRALSASRPFAAGAQPKLYGTTDGKLGPPASEIEIAQVQQIAMGVLTDKADGALKGVNARDAQIEILEVEQEVMCAGWAAACDGWERALKTA